MLLTNDGNLTRSNWEHDKDAVAVDPPSYAAAKTWKTFSLSEFLTHAETLLSEDRVVGVRLEPSDDPHDLTPYLDRIALIEISFPKYTDGRGYSQAQLLRRRLGYEGELRAVGHVLRDQILYMNRSGFDAYQTSRAALPEILEALAEYSAFYQPAADGHHSVFARRHKKA